MNEKESVFNKYSDLIGFWVNNGNIHRPNKKRFFEKWNNIDKCFDVWIFEPVEVIIITYDI